MGGGELSTQGKCLLIGGFLLTGSINTLTKKFQLVSCAPTLSHPTVDERDGCPEGQKPFAKPWTQNMQMFIEKPLFYIFLLPACCDVLGTGIGGIGMLYISASVWQMMRGSMIIFTSFLSIIFLKKKLYCFNWMAVGTSTIGLLLVGVSAIMDESLNKKKGSENKSVPLGIFFTVIAQLFAATQMVVEEKFVKQYGAPPPQVVGSEGLWGIMIMIVMLSVMFWIPGEDDGSYENVIDSLHMMTSNGLLAFWILLYLVSISLFNYFGVMIAGKLSAVHRTINDAIRTAIVWGVQTILFYCGSKTYGVELKKYDWMQVLGFCFLVAGSLFNSKVIKYPFITYPEEETAQAAMASPSHSHGAPHSLPAKAVMASMQEQTDGSQRSTAPA